MANALNIALDADTAEQLQQAAEWVGVDVVQAAQLSEFLERAPHLRRS